MPRPSAAVLGAGTVLLGTTLSLFGIVWDVQWHVDVGPDTFFTLSHLMLYAGSAVAGLGALAMVLRATFARRAGQPEDGTLRVLGFDTPPGYLVAGAGAALFLLYGLMDLWWHTVYGFDATLASPPHMALFSSITVTMVGSIIIFGQARDERWGRAGLAIALVTLITFSPLMFDALSDLPLPFDGATAMAAFCCTLSLVFAAGAVGRPEFAVTVAAVLAGLQAVLWVWASWSAHTYADYVGPPLRDGLEDLPPEMPSIIPMFLLAAAFLVTGALQYAPRGRAWVAGAVGGLVTAVSLDLQVPLVGNGPLAAPATLVANAVAGLLFGAVAGFLAWRFAVILRTPLREGQPA